MQKILAPENPGLVLGDADRAAQGHVTLRRHDLDHASADLDISLVVDLSQRDTFRMLDQFARDLDAAPGPYRPAVPESQRRAVHAVQAVADIAAQDLGPLRKPAGLRMRLQPAHIGREQ